VISIGPLLIGRRVKADARNLVIDECKIARAGIRSVDVSLIIPLIARVTFANNAKCWLLAPSGFDFALAIRQFRSCRRIGSGAPQREVPLPAEYLTLLSYGIWSSETETESETRYSVLMTFGPQQWKPRR
jgi:hypothetical protein